MLLRVHHETYQSDLPLRLVHVERLILRGHSFGQFAIGLCQPRVRRQRFANGVMQAVRLGYFLHRVLESYVARFEAPQQAAAELSANAWRTFTVDGAFAAIEEFAGEGHPFTVRAVAGERLFFGCQRDEPEQCPVAAKATLDAQVGAGRWNSHTDNSRLASTNVNADAESRTSPPELQRSNSLTQLVVSFGP